MNRLYPVMMASLLSAGCGVMEPVVHAPSNSTEVVIQPYDLSLYQRSIHLFNASPIDFRVNQLLLEPRVDRLVILVEINAQTGQSYRGVPVDQYTLEMVRRFNETLPSESFSTEIFRVGAPANTSYPEGFLSSRDERRAAINTPEMIPSVGETLEQGVDFLTEHLAKREGSVAIITFAPWGSLTLEALNGYERLAQRYLSPTGASISSQVKPWRSIHAGERICIYQIGVGNRLARSKVDKRFGCGSSESADLISQPNDMAAFVERAMYKGPKDSDRDGIFDYLDQCPSTERGRLVDYQGCLKF